MSSYHHCSKCASDQMMDGAYLLLIILSIVLLFSSPRWAPFAFALMGFGGIWVFALSKPSMTWTHWVLLSANLTVSLCGMYLWYTGRLPQIGRRISAE